METHVNFHDSETKAAQQASDLKKLGWKVTLAGPCDPTYCSNEGDYPNQPVPGRRWVVLATKSGLTIC